MITNTLYSQTQKHDPLLGQTSKTVMVSYITSHHKQTTPLVNLSSSPNHKQIGDISTLTQVLACDRHTIFGLSKQATGIISYNRRRKLKR